MHNLLYAKRRQLGTISLKGYAKDSGVTDKNFLTKLVDSVYGWSVRTDLLEGVKKGVKDIPYFFINGEVYKGPVSVNGFSKVIDPLTKVKKTAPKAAPKAAKKTA
jgi:protein-disulfide isomerase